MSTENKPKVWKSILCVVPCSVVFVLTQVLLAFLILLLGVIISKIPLLKNILNFIFIMRGESINMFATITSVFFAYLLTTFIQDKMMKDAPTNTLSRRIFGVIMALIHFYSLIVNLSAGNNFFVNIVCLITALVFIFNNDTDF